MSSYCFGEAWPTRRCLRPRAPPRQLEPVHVPVDEEADPGLAKMSAEKVSALKPDEY